MIMMLVMGRTECFLSLTTFYLIRERQEETPSRIASSQPQRLWRFMR